MISRAVPNCEKVHDNIYWSNLDYIRQHSQSRLRMSTLFSDPACVFLISIKPCYEVHVENYLPLKQKPIRAIRMHCSYWKVPFSCCENLNVRCLPAFDSGDTHWGGLCWTSTGCEVFYLCLVVGNSSETAQCFTNLCTWRKKVSDIFSSKESWVSFDIVC